MDSDSLLLVGIIGVIALVIGLVLGVAFSRSSSQNGHKDSTKQQARPAGERSAAAERQRMREIYNLISAITSTLQYQRVLDTALDLSSSVLSTPGAPAERVLSSFLLFTQSETKRPT